MPLSGKMIMVVDDDSDILAVTVLMLQYFHAKAEGFTRPDEAYQKFKSQPKAYDMVITDIRMPSMNGFELGDKIHSIRADEPILYTSGFDSDKELPGATALDDIVEKPFDIPKFCDKVRHKLKID